MRKIITFIMFPPVNANCLLSVVVSTSAPNGNFEGNNFSHNFFRRVSSGGVNSSTKLTLFKSKKKNKNKKSKKKTKKKKRKRDPSR